MTTKRAWRNTATDALGDVARLSADNRRMATELKRFDGLQWQYDVMREDFAAALDELRRLNGTLEVVSAVDRALPLGEEDVA